MRIGRRAYISVVSTDIYVLVCRVCTLDLHLLEAGCEISIIFNGAISIKWKSHSIVVLKISDILSLNYQNTVVMRDCLNTKKLNLLITV